MVSIIVPIFNEEQRLNEGIEKIYSYLKSVDFATEVIIVDDGSKDKTPDLLDDLSKEYPFKRVTHPTNKGKGAAIKTGVEEAKGDLILFTDIDLSVPIEFLGIYLKELTPDVDVIIGSRVLKNSKIIIRQSRIRESMGDIFTTLVNLVLNVGVTDFTCGFKLFRDKPAEQIFKRQLTKRWAFDAETLFLAKKFRYKIKEVAVNWEHKEGTKVKFPQDIIDSLFSLIKIRINDLKHKYE